MRKHELERARVGKRLSIRKRFRKKASLIPFNEEFDPGSGRTLAARLTHASRTELIDLKFSDGGLINLVANG